MKTQSPDTHPEVERILIEGYRRMSVAEKLSSVRAMNQAVQTLQMGDIRRRHPDASEREVRLRLASRWLGPDLMRKAFGWDSEKEGY
jgi:hypothetical protein